MKNLNSFIQKIRTSAFMESFKFTESDELEYITDEEFLKNVPIASSGITAPDEIVEPAKNN